MCCGVCPQANSYTEQYGFSFSYHMLTDPQAKLPNHWDQHNLSDLLLYYQNMNHLHCVCSFEVHMLNMYPNELKRRLGRVHIKIHCCSVTCIFFKPQQPTLTAAYAAQDFIL